MKLDHAKSKHRVYEIIHAKAKNSYKIENSMKNRTKNRGKWKKSETQTWTKKFFYELSFSNPFFFKIESYFVLEQLLQNYSRVFEFRKWFCANLLKSVRFPFMFLWRFSLSMCACVSRWWVQECCVCAQSGSTKVRVLLDLERSWLIGNCQK